MGLGAAGYTGTKLAQKAFGDEIKKNKKTDNTWKRYKIDSKKGLSNVEICNIMENEENFRGVFAIDIHITKKN